MKPSEINKCFFYMLHTRFEQYYDIVQTTKEYAIYRLTTLNDYHKGCAKLRLHFKH